MRTYKTLKMEIEKCNGQLSEFRRLAKLHQNTDPYYTQQITKRENWLECLQSELTMCEIRYFWAKKMKTLAAEN